MSVLSIVQPWHLVSVLLFLSESFTAYLMEDNGMIKALCHYKQAPGPAHLFLFNDETN